MQSQIIHSSNVFGDISEVIKQLERDRDIRDQQHIDAFVAWDKARDQLQQQNAELQKALLAKYRQGMTDAAAIVGNERSFDTTQHAILQRLHAAILAARDAI